MNYWLGSQRQKAAAGNNSTRSAARSVVGDEMVQDPYCKVYVPLTRSVERRVGGRTHHFCSEDCARKFQKGIDG